MRYILPVFSLIQPIFALLLVLIQGSDKKTRYSIAFCMALGFGTIAMGLNPDPSFDLYRHYNKFDRNLGEYSLTEVLEMAQPGYKLMDSLVWFIETLSLPPHTMVFIIVFISYYLVFSVFTNLKLNFLQDSSQKYIFISFLLVLFSLNFVGTTSGLRNPLANTIIIYATYHLFFYKRYVTFLILSIFAFFIHPFALSYALIALSSYIFSFWSSNAKKLLYIALFLALANSLITSGFLSFLSLFEQYDWFKPIYFEDEFIEERGQKVNSFGVLTDIVIPFAPLILAYFYLLFNKPKHNSALYLLLCTIFIYFSLFISNPILIGRMGIFFNILFSIYIILECRNKYYGRNKRLFFAIYFLSLSFYSLVYFFIFNSYIFSAFPKVLLPFLFVFFDIL